MSKIKYLLWAITLVFCLLTFYSFSTQAQNIMAQVDTSYTGIKNLEVKARFCKVEIGAVSNTREKLLENEEFGKYVTWVKKQTKDKKRDHKNDRG